MCDCHYMSHYCVLSSFAGGGFCVFSEGLGGLLNWFSEVIIGGVMFWLWVCSKNLKSEEISVVFPLRVKKYPGSLWAYESI